MKGFFKVAFVLAIVAGVLYISRPDAADFDEYIQEEIRANSLQNMPQTGQYTKPMDGQTVHATLKDYYVVTIIEAEIDEEKRTYLGLIGQFFPF